MSAWWLIQDPVKESKRIRHLVQQGYLVQTAVATVSEDAYDTHAHLIAEATHSRDSAVRSNPATRSPNQGTDAMEGPLLQWTLCEGTYDGYLQGVATDGESLYWSHTTRLVKTDLTGKISHPITVLDNHGDLTWQDGNVYVAVEFGEFNEPPCKTDSWVYFYDDARLEFLQKYPVPELVHGAGGIAYHEGTFVLVGGLPAGEQNNLVFSYDQEFRFQSKHELPTGPTRHGDPDRRAFR